MYAFFFTCRLQSDKPLKNAKEEWIYSTLYCIVLFLCILLQR